MRTDFAPSVNIVRDSGKHLDYILTANSKSIFNQIASDFGAGIRAFNLVGSYGSGKSAFLWAFEKTLTRRAEYFGKMNGQFNHVRDFRFLNIVGEYQSITSTFARRLNIRRIGSWHTKIFDGLNNLYNGVEYKKRGLVVVIDEFGKFLEYAANHGGELELYFVQQLAEYCNDTKKKIILLTSLHQAFDSYARGLDSQQRQEWQKVKGRLRELPFNEPVEQLLFLASKRLELKRPAGFVGENAAELTEAVEKSRLFPLRNYPSKTLSRKLHPFDILSAATLALSLQKYGQNERSLFTFLESNDHNGLLGFDSKQNPYYNLSCVYDYLLYNFYSFIYSRDNPHYLQWAAIRSAIERAEGHIEADCLGTLKLVKAIGLLNLFSSEGGVIDEEFLTSYGRLALGIEDPSNTLQRLEDSKVVRFVRFKRRYVLFEGTDFDFESALRAASEKVDQTSDLVAKLKEFVSFPIISSKSVHYKRGTPRFFEFVLSESPITDRPKDEIDGIVNLIVSEAPNRQSVKAASEKSEEAILFGLYLNTKEIKDSLWEIEKANLVIDTITEDRIAKRELLNLRAHYVENLNRLIVGNLFSDRHVCWMFKGKEVRIENRGDLNRCLSRVCERVYSKAPVLKNELINRHRLPGAISSARKKLLEQLFRDWDKENLAFPPGKFPPEKTIYLSLLKHTGIHRKRNGVFSIVRPLDKSFLPLWNECEQFLESAKASRKHLDDLVERLRSKPFKLKQGLLEFWLPMYLFAKRQDYVLFGEQGYIPNISPDVLELVLKYPDRFEIKAIDIRGLRLELFNKYRLFLNKQPDTRISNSSFVETIKPFLAFYRSLPEYTKRTKRLPTSAIALREAIATASDPEKVFFEDFPHALGFSIDELRKSDSLIEQYINQLQNTIKELRTCFDSLVDRVESHLLREIGHEDLRYPVYVDTIKTRYSAVKDFLMLPKQKSFYTRLLSVHEDRKAWLLSIAHVAFGRSIEFLSDEEEPALYSSLSDLIAELDNLCDIASTQDSRNDEETVKLEVTTVPRGSRRALIRFSKSQGNDAAELETKIRSILSGNSKLNIIALLKLIEEQLTHE